MKIILLKDNQQYKDKLYRYLVNVDTEFNPSLSSRIDLKQYAERVTENAYICCALSYEDNIIGVVVFYANDFEKRYAYIPLVSVCSEYRRQGIARKLMDYVLFFIKSSGNISIVGIHTYNQYAFDLYVKLGFKEVSNIDGRLYLEKYL